MRREMHGPRYSNGEDKESAVMAETTAGGIGLEISDVSGQKTARVHDMPTDASVGELIEGLLAQMKLPRNDVSGRPLTYHALLEREGRHLHASEVVGEALHTGDKVILQPNIDAGEGRFDGDGDGSRASASGRRIGDERRPAPSPNVAGEPPRV
jgi:hypothetical protein